jgi:hypothetical protein
MLRRRFETRRLTATDLVTAGVDRRPGGATESSPDLPDQSDFASQERHEDFVIACGCSSLDIRRNKDTNRCHSRNPCKW